MALEKLPNRTYPALGLSLTERAIKEAFSKRCSSTELEELRQHFLKKGPLRCTYCGKSKPDRWDHVYPVSQGGDTVKGNLMPACGSCDDSKQNRSPQEWLFSESKKKPPLERLGEIVRTIAEHRKDFSYEPSQFPDKLTNEQKAIYAEFQTHITTLREFFKKHGITDKGSA